MASLGLARLLLRARVERDATSAVGGLGSSENCPESNEHTSSCFHAAPVAPTCHFASDTNERGRMWEDVGCLGGRAGGASRELHREILQKEVLGARSSRLYFPSSLLPRLGTLSLACSLPYSAASSGPGSASAQGCTIRTEDQRCAGARSRAGGAPRPVLRQKHVMRERPTPEGKRALYGGHGGAVDGVQHTHYNESGGQIIPWGNREGGAARRVKLFTSAIGAQKRK